MYDVWQNYVQTPAVIVVAPFVTPSLLVPPPPVTAFGRRGWTTTLWPGWTASRGTHAAIRSGLLRCRAIYRGGEEKQENDTWYS